MLKNLLFIVFLISITSGCSTLQEAFTPKPSPFEIQSARLDDMYSSGSISYEKYAELKQRNLIAAQNAYYQKQQNDIMRQQNYYTQQKDAQRNQIEAMQALQNGDLLKYKILKEQGY